MLNINYKAEDPAEEHAQELAELGHDEVIDPETGKPALREEYQYFLVSLARVFVDPEDELRIDFLKENGRKQPQKRLNGSRRSSKKTSDDSLKENARMAKNSPYENRIYETKIVKTENLKECAHCGVEFVYNHKKQKYCTDDCRKAAWEERNGRKLKLKARKK